MKDWKTTLAGAVTGVLQLLAMGVNWKSILAAAGLAALGALSGDKTGGVK